jgi:hypothetical protein
LGVVVTSGIALALARSGVSLAMPQMTRRDAASLAAAWLTMFAVLAGATLA